MATIQEVQFDSPIYYVGQRVRVEFEFRLYGVPTDPTVIQVAARNPVTESTVFLVYPNASLTRVGTGLYEADFMVSDPGQWHFRAEGAGVVDAVTEVHLDVLASTTVY